MPVRVGLTGGIASGKSSVAARLGERGAVVIDSDVLAREAVAPGTPGLAAVAAEFGDALLRDDGSLDRPALGEIVFADPSARARLESIVHPIVRSRSAELAAQALRDRGERVVVVCDVPLLVETGQAGDFDAVVVVDAPEQAQIERLASQRGMGADEARARIAAQATREQRRAAADFVIVNDGARSDLLQAVDRLWPRLQALRG